MSEEGNDIRAAFVRQRRNLMAISMVLIVAQIPESLRIGITELYVHPPFTIGMVLWMVWGYWFWRYYTCFHDLGEKYFLRKYRERLDVIGTPIILRKLKRNLIQYAAVDAEIKQKDPNGICQLKIAQSSYGHKGPAASRLSLKLSLYLEDPDKTLTSGTLTERPEITISGVTFFFTATRAWVYVIFRTTLFNEYQLPFLFAALAGTYGLYRNLCAS
jgi:hypothetical protein